MPEELVSDSSTRATESESAPSEFAPVYAQAERARAENDLARAHEFYVRATELNPNHAGAWAGRAASATNLDETIMSWAYAVALAPDNPDARAALNTCVAGKIVQSDTAQVPALIALGRLLARLGEKTQAERLFQAATELDERNADAWVWRAGVTEDVQQMIGYLKQALVHEPNNAQAKAGLQWACSLPVPPAPAPPGSEETVRLIEEAQSALASKDKVRAHDLFRQVTVRDPQNEDAWLWRASTTTDVDEALISIERALAINPDNPSAREAQSWLRAKRVRGNIIRTENPVPLRVPVTRSQQILRLLVPAFVLIVLLVLISLYVVARR